MKEIEIISAQPFVTQKEFLYITKVEVTKTNMIKCFNIEGKAFINNRYVTVWMNYYPNEKLYDDSFGQTKTGDGINLDTLFFNIVPNILLDADTTFVFPEKNVRGRMGVFQVDEPYIRKNLIAAKNVVDKNSMIYKTIKALKSIVTIVPDNDEVLDYLRKKAM